MASKPAATVQAGICIPIWVLWLKSYQIGNSVLLEYATTAPFSWPAKMNSPPWCATLAASVKFSLGVRFVAI